MERVAELTVRVAELTQRVELTEDAAGHRALGAQNDTIARDADNDSNPIELITENGFSIVRPWESGNSPAPTGGRYRFSLSDGFIERAVTVEISRGLMTELSLRTRGRIRLSSSFWICCAERHLANYVTNHAEFPEDDQLIAEELSGEDILLALRWDARDEE